MEAWGVTRLRFGGDPGHFLPGVPSECPDLETTLRDARILRRQDLSRRSGRPRRVRIPDRIAAVRDEWPNLTLERVGTEAEPLLDFLSNQFPGRWQYEAENFTRVPGGGDDYWLLRNEGTPVGFGRANTPESGIAAATSTGRRGSTGPSAVSARSASTRRIAGEDGVYGWSPRSPNATAMRATTGWSSTGRTSWTTTANSASNRGSPIRRSRRESAGR